MKSDRHKRKEDSINVVKMGEDKAFDFFFRQYYTTLCFFANSILHNEEEAKDVVQDCFLKLWNSKTINERSETVKSFLYTAVRNRCVDLLRKKKVNQKAKLQISKSGDDNFEYFDEVAFAEMIRQVFGLIEELPGSTQQVFKLYFFDGKKCSDIANEINSTPQAVRKKKERALKFIRQKFLFFSTWF
jgi:RNA polymerase sigma-70 factor (family 1)